jgi:hypothetical protein
MLTQGKTLKAAREPATIDRIAAIRGERAMDRRVRWAEQRGTPMTDRQIDAVEKLLGPFIVEGAVETKFWKDFRFYELTHLGWCPASGLNAPWSVFFQLVYPWWVTKVEMQTRIEFIGCPKPTNSELPPLINGLIYIGDEFD